MDRLRRRAWGSTFTMGIAFPLAALVAALLVFATTSISAGLVMGLALALVPWALVAGGVGVGPWVMTVVGLGVPGALVVIYEAPGAIFLGLVALGWVVAEGRSLGAEIFAGIAGSLIIPILYASSDWAGNREGFVFFATGGLITWCIGRMLRSERELVAALTDAQERLKVAASAAERQRIARDVHDVVGHSLTVVLLNVVGARRVLFEDPTAASEALDRAEQVGRDSLQNVRAIVGLLRSPDEAESQPPQPGAADIADLVQTAAASGISVRAEMSGELEAVDPYAGLAAFRLVQEAISNAEHHAPESEVLVRVTSEPSRLTVSVRNGPGRHPPSGSSRGGTGLDGMRQRLAALGGTISIGPDAGGWLVEGSIPLQRSDADVSG